MPSRLQRQFHVTGTQYISTDKVQSQTLNTGGTAETFSPWANKPRAFFTIFRIVGAALQRSQQNQRSAILPLYQPIHSSEIYLFSGAFAGVVVTLSAWKSALFRKISLSERSEFEIFLNAFSRFSDT